MTRVWRAGESGVEARTVLCGFPSECSQVIRDNAPLHRPKHLPPPDTTKNFPTQFFTWHFALRMIQYRYTMRRYWWTGKNTTESLWKCQLFPLMGSNTMGHFGIHTTLINTHKWGNMQRDSRRLLLKQRIKSVQLDLDIASSYMDSKDVRKLQDLYMDLHFQMWRLRWHRNYFYLVSPLVLLLYSQVL